MKGRCSRTRRSPTDGGRRSGPLVTALRWSSSPPGRCGSAGPVILAGPTCDSADILYEKTAYRLPLALRIGDKVEILSTGAYTASYASVGFNGFAPIRTYCI